MDGDVNEMPEAAAVVLVVWRRARGAPRNATQQLARNMNVLLRMRSMLANVGVINTRLLHQREQHLSRIGAKACVSWGASVTKRSEVAAHPAREDNSAGQ